MQRQVEDLRKLGIELEVLDFRGRSNLSEYYKAYRRLRCLLKKERYDLIHAHFGQAGFVSIFQHKAPVVITFHGSDLLGFPDINKSGKFKGCLLKYISTFAAARAQEVVVVSEQLSRILSWRSNHFIPMGINRSIFTPIPREKALESLGWSSTGRTVLFVGNPMNSIKRYELAVNAIALASQVERDIKLCVCWNKPLERVADFMNAADVLLVTSIHEGGPLVIREALACNLPIVSVDVGDARRRIGSIEGCVVTPDDRPETVAAGLIKVLQRGQRLKDGCGALRDLDERELALRLLAVYNVALRKPLMQCQ